MDINLVANFQIVSPRLVLGCQTDDLFLGELEVVPVQVACWLETPGHANNHVGMESFGFQFAQENLQEETHDLCAHLQILQTGRTRDEYGGK